MTLVYIALGGALGAVLRWLSVSAAVRLLGTGFPFGTLAVNVVGSLLMGVVAACLLERSDAPRAVAFLMPGVLGGFTTFSAFSLDAARLIETGRLAAAATYTGVSVMASLLAVFIGLWLGRMLS